MNIDKIREDIESILESSNQDLVQENANTDGTSPMGMMSLFASTISTEFAKGLIDEKTLERKKKKVVTVQYFYNN